MERCYEVPKAHGPELPGMKGRSCFVFWSRGLLGLHRVWKIVSCIVSGSKVAFAPESGLGPKQGNGPAEWQSGHRGPRGTREGPCQGGHAPWRLRCNPPLLAFGRVAHPRGVCAEGKQRSSLETMGPKENQAVYAKLRSKTPPVSCCFLGAAETKAMGKRAAL